VFNGVPFDVAFQVGDVYRAGMAIKFSEFNGHRFNVERMRFEKEKG
jgi:hypothetical protein